MNRKGFTLIELLIVVAIIAILAAIAVPNFLEAQTRARVSRTQNDLRTIDLAMESYRIDWNGYPLAVRESYLLPPGTVVQTDRRLLTTPIAYVDTVPPDIFRIIAGLSQPSYWVYGYAYDANGKGSYSLYPRLAWMTWSNGPDQSTQVGGYRSYKTILKSEKDNAAAGGEYTGSNGMRYDPTNGTVSLGDIYRIGGEAMSR